MIFIKFFNSVYDLKSDKLLSLIVPNCCRDSINTFFSIVYYKNFDVSYPNSSSQTMGLSPQAFSDERETR